MAGRDPIDDAAFDDLVGDLAAGPVGDRPAGDGGGLAGEGDDPADLLGGDPRWSPRPRGVGQAAFDTQVVFGDGLEADPAVTPGPGGRYRDVQHAGDLGVVQAIGGGQDDPGAEDGLLRRGVATDERLEALALGLEQDDGGWLGATHGEFRCQCLGQSRCRRHSTKKLEPGCTRGRSRMMFFSMTPPGKWAPHLEFSAGSRRRSRLSSPVVGSTPVPAADPPYLSPARREFVHPWRFPGSSSEQDARAHRPLPW